jgi:hypothetical protein
MTKQDIINKTALLTGQSKSQTAQTIKQEKLQHLGYLNI